MNLKHCSIKRTGSTGMMIVVASLLAMACGDGTASSEVSVDTLPGGALRTMSSAPTGWHDSTGAWTLELERTIAPDNDSDDALGNVGQMLPTRSGDLVVLEFAPTQIRRFPADGSAPVVIGRPGEGPSEFSQPTATLLGDTLVVLDPPLTRLSLLQLDGTLLASNTVTTTHFGAPITIDREGRVGVVDAVRGEGVPPRTSQRIRYSPTGERLDSVRVPVAVEPLVWELQMGGSGTAWYHVPDSPTTETLMLGNGQMLYGRTDRDEFVVSSTGLDTVRIFGRSGTTAQSISSAARDSIVASWDERPLIKSVADPADLPSTYPLWVELSEDDQGNIWVRRGKPFQSFDVYDSAGVYLGEVASPWGRTSTSWLNGRVAVLRIDDEGFPTVEIYRVSRTANP